MMRTPPSRFHSFNESWQQILEALTEGCMNAYNESYERQRQEENCLAFLF